MKSITRNGSSMDVGCCDMVLYNGNRVCLYFGENTYSFTSLGKITGMTDTGIKEMLDMRSSQRCSRWNEAGVHEGASVRRVNVSGIAPRSRPLCAVR